MSGGRLTQGWVRLARGAILGGSSLFLATAAHLAGGGSLPGGGLLSIAGVALALVAVSLTARRMRFVPLLLLLSLEQALLHLLFQAAGGLTRCASVAMPGHTMPGHTMTASSLCGAGSAAVAGWSMLLGHAIAVAATAWLLARGERWLWRAVDRIHAYATARPGRFRRQRPIARPYVTRRPAAVGWPAADPRGPPIA